MILKGTLQKALVKKNAEKIIGISGIGEILDVALINDDGNWELDVKDPPQTLIVQCKGTCIAAIAGSPLEINSIHLPELSTVNFHFENYKEGIVLYVDPVSLDRFPQELIIALRKNKEDIVDLHVNEYSVGSDKISLKVQNGKYRFSVSRINFHITGNANRQSIHLESVSDMKSGQTVVAVNGEVTLSITKDANYKFTLSSD